MPLHVQSYVDWALGAGARPARWPAGAPDDAKDQENPDVALTGKSAINESTADLRLN